MELASQFQILATVILASLLGGVVGFEREISHKPAGIRTNMLVAASAALLVALGAILVSAYEQSPAIEYIKTDPIRIVEAIIVGVSFIGGGLIIQKKGGNVENLTTAATVLLAATIGISVALDQYILAIGITIFNMIVNYAVFHFEKKIPGSTKRK